MSMKFASRMVEFQLSDIAENSKFKTSVTSDNVLIATGSQQALDLAGKLFLDEGDVVICESPTYLGALDAFKAYRPRFVEVRPMTMEWYRKIWKRRSREKE